MRIAAVVLALIGLGGVAAPAVAEVYQKADNGFVLRHVAEVKAGPDEAWGALIRLGEWWGKQHTYSGDSANMSIDPRAGGCWCEILPNKDSPRAAPRGSIEHMRVLYAEQGRALRMAGGLGPLQSEPVTGVLTITLKPRDDGGTRVQWEYVVGGYFRYKVDQIAPLVDSVLAEQLQWLGMKLGPLPAVSPAPASPTPSESPPQKQPLRDKPAENPATSR